MKLFPVRSWVIGFGLIVSPLAVLRAGDEVATRPTLTSQQSGPTAAAAQMETYLQSQKITHTIDISDPKAVNDTQGPLTVKVYGDLDSAQQDAICAALTATAKKTRTDGSTVQFYAQERPTGGGAGYQASSLPSGNGNVSFDRNKAASPTYKLKRTVRL